MNEKERKKLDHKIDRLEKMIKQKNHGPDSNELKLLQQLSQLYAKRKAAS